jgi:hypothetical protein
MNTSEISACMKQDHRVAPYFVGVYPRNKLPSLEKFPSALIANTDVNKGPGEHWVAMYFPTDGQPMYFDSYGLPPQKQEFSKYMGSQYDHNNMQLQSPFSSTCGQYAIFFVAMACRGCTMKQIQDLFDKKNLEDNDVLVTDFVNRNYDMKTRVFDVDFLTKQICTVMKDVK